MKKATRFLLSLLTLSLAAPAATVTYQFTLDTSSLSGPAVLEWALIPAGSPAAVTATIVDEIYSGMTPGAYQVPLGASGTVGPPPFMDNSTSDNRVQRLITSLNSSTFLSFQVIFEGPGVDPIWADGTVFAVYLTTPDFLGGAAGLNNGFLGEVDLGFDTGNVSSVFAANGSLLTITQVPEPASVALTAGGLALVAWIRRRHGAAA